MVVSAKKQKNKTPVHYIKVLTYELHLPVLPVRDIILCISKYTIFVYFKISTFTRIRSIYLILVNVLILNTAMQNVSREKAREFDLFAVTYVVECDSASTPKQENEHS